MKIPAFDSRFIEASVMLVALTCFCTAVHIKKGTTMTIEKDQAVIESPDAVKYFDGSAVVCALKCISADQCCGANYRKETLYCSINIANCSTTVKQIGTIVIKNVSNNAVSTECSDCIKFGSSSYKVISPASDWQTSRDNCIVQGGKLAEIETLEENDFLKSAVVNTGFSYWVGGYNFNQDGDLEWNSHPNQAMLFTDWATGSSEPNNPSSQRCLSLWNGYTVWHGEPTCAAESYPLYVNLNENKYGT